MPLCTLANLPLNVRRVPKLSVGWAGTGAAKLPVQSGSEAVEAKIFFLRSTSAAISFCSSGPGSTNFGATVMEVVR
jgi:hypothetical protein